MEILTFFKNGLILLFEFVRDNIASIIVVIITVVLFLLATLATLTSLKKLKVSVFSHYPFDRFFPQSKKWSALYFLTVILFLGLLIFFLVKGMFYMEPA